MTPRHGLTMGAMNALPRIATQMLNLEGMNVVTHLPLLKTFADAWNRHDIDALMVHMAEDGVFLSSNGSRAEGSEAVREAFASVFASYPDARWDKVIHFVSNDRGVSEWVFSGTDAEDGSAVKEPGCDIFTFKEGRIAVKDTYLK